MAFPKGYWKKPAALLAIDYTDIWTGKSKYIGANLDGKQRELHRWLWEKLKGSIPNDHIIDHINGNTLDNKIENLRCIPKVINSRNSKLFDTNKSGINGVTRIQMGNLYYWAATFVEPSTRKAKNKYFSIKKLGEDAAKQAAISFRKEIEETLLKPFGYTNRHGL